MSKARRAPAHLRADTKRWWLEVTREYELENHHTKLLTAAAESWDRMQEAREQVTADGAYVRDRFGQLKAHPALAIERDNKIAFARLLRELDLDVESGPGENRPPSLRRFK